MKPRLTEEQYEELTDILQAAEEHSERLSAWEVTFVDETQARLALWDRRILISDRQWESLQRIKRRIG